MKKNGFTLLELMGVLIVLAILALLVTPVISKTIKNNKKKLYDIQIEVIEKAAKDYAIKNKDLLPEEGEAIIITLGELKKSGLIKEEVRNPMTKELFSNDLKIQIGNSHNQYTYTVLEDEVSGDQY